MTGGRDDLIGSLGLRCLCSVEVPCFHDIFCM
jgi:hypothetical protein